MCDTSKITESRVMVQRRVGKYIAQEGEWHSVVQVVGEGGGGGGRGEGQAGP